MYPRKPKLLYLCLTAAFWLLCSELAYSQPDTLVAFGQHHDAESNTELSDTSIPVQSKLVIPVFYATDRELDLGNTSNIGYTNVQLPQGRLNYGVKNIVLVGQSMSDKAVENIQGLGWWMTLPTVTPLSADATIRNCTLTHGQLINRLKEIISSGPADRPLVLYINGCCQSYDSSMDAAARLAKFYEAPVLAYAWAAMPPTEKQYRINEDRQQQGIRTFINFLSDLEAQISTDKVILIAHSMGNRFLSDVLKNRWWSHGANAQYPKFKCVDFCCADVNIADFSGQEQGLPFNASQTWITNNDTDPALTASEIQRGLYRRLGAPHSSLTTLTNTDDVDFINIAKPYRFKHGFPMDIMAQLNRGNSLSYQSVYTVIPVSAHLYQAKRK